jgi:hypothetical protein
LAGRNVRSQGLRDGFQERMPALADGAVCDHQHASDVGVGFAAVAVAVFDPKVPVLCMDEQPVQLLIETRSHIAATANHGKRVDY